MRRNEMNRNDVYLALDLELNNAEDGSTPNPPIIQVGVAIGNYANYTNNNFITRKWYFDPHEPIFPFITNLTGITDIDVVTKSVTHQQFAIEFADMMKLYKPFVNPVTWGGGDSVELKKEMLDRNITFPFFGHRWIDVKTWYVLRLLANGKRPVGGLRSAMNTFKMKFDGEPHRADVDALNTLKLFFCILERQEKIQTMIEQVKEL